MTKKPEALRLAEVAPYLEGGERGQWIVAAATELRRLHDMNAELLAALKAYQKAGCGNSTDFALQSDAGILARAAIAKAEGETNEL